MVMSPYFSDEEVVSSLRQQYDRDLQYSIDFYFWLNTARQTADGFVVQVMSRKFLINKYTGMVIKELD